MSIVPQQRLEILNAATEELEKLLEEVRKLPPMTEEQKIEQRISWAWGNAALSHPDGEFEKLLPRDRWAAEVWREEWRKLRRQLDEAGVAIR